MADMAASVLAKLKNKAKSSGISYQQCLQLFFQEEFLRRLAGSKYAENFVLKGGLFIYTLTNFESRATVDVDFLMRGLGTMDGHTIRIYDKDRLICDCLRYRNKMDKEIFNKAIQKYIADPEKSIPKLMEYAGPLRVKKLAKDLIGVWL